MVDFPPLLINAVDEGGPDYMEVIATTDGVDPSGWVLRGVNDNGSTDFTWNLSNSPIGTMSNAQVYGEDEGSNFNCGWTSSEAWCVELENPSGTVVDRVAKTGHSARTVEFTLPAGSSDRAYYRTVLDDTDTATDWDYEGSSLTSKQGLNPGQSGTFASYTPTDIGVGRDVSGNRNDIRVFWTLHDPIDRLEVLRRSGSSSSTYGDYTVLADVDPTSTAYVDDAPEGTWHYRVAAYVDDGQGGETRYLSANRGVDHTTYVNPPINPTVSTSGDDVTVSWDAGQAPETAEAFEILQSTASHPETYADYDVVGSASPSETSFTHQPAPERYFYRVAAVTADHDGGALTALTEEVSVQHQVEVVEWTSSGENQWTVPNSVTELDVRLDGAEGGEGDGFGVSGGDGGRVHGTLPVTPGETLNVWVGGEGSDPLYTGSTGGGGFNGGGEGHNTDDSNSGSGGGGGTDIRRGGNTYADRVVVAGGGGGSSDGSGGDGGADVGESAGGGGGTQMAGGAGDGYASDGGFGFGGDGGSQDSDEWGGAGGGGGWYGGGGEDSGSSFSVSGAGGGSNYVGGFSQVSTNARGEGGPGDGAATLKYYAPVQAPTAVTAEYNPDGSLTVTVTVSTPELNVASLSVEISRDGAPFDSRRTIPTDGSGSYSVTFPVDKEAGADASHTVRARGESDASSVLRPSAWVEPPPYPAQPTAPTLTEQATSVDVEWTSPGTPQNFRIEASSDGGQSWPDSTIVDGQTTTGTLAGLRTGERYDVRVVAVNPATSATGPPATTTTPLPDVSGPTLDNGTEDTLGVSFDAPQNYGYAQIQYKESDASTWSWGWEQYTGVTSADRVTATISNLEDGEAYDLRIRARTEHQTGAWVQLSGVTLMPTMATVSATSNTPNRMEVAWDDVYDNEVRYTVERQERFKGSYEPTAVEEVATLPANTSTFTDGSVMPSTTYRWRVRAATEHRAATSEWTEATVATTPQGRQRAPRRGWHVELVHPSTGRVVRPSVVGEPERLPAVNDLPRIRIPVPRDEKWLAEEWDDAELRVWYDGERQPIERLEATSITPESVVLEGRGGLDLLDRVTAEFDVEAAHVAAETLLTDSVGYDVVVDDPNVGVREDVTLQNPSGESNLRDLLSTAVGDTDPLAYRNGRLELLQTGWVFEAENADSHWTGSGDGLDGSFSIVSGSQYSGGEAARFGDFTGRVRVEFDVEYTIPADRVQMVARSGSEPEFAPDEMEWFIDGTRYARQTYGEDAEFFFDWSDPAEFSRDWPSDSSGDLEPGTHTLEVRVGNCPDSAHGWTTDLIGVVDSKFYGDIFDFSESPDGNGYLPDPALYPRDYDLVFDSAVVSKAIAEATVTATVADPSSVLTSLSFDGGGSYTDGVQNTATATNGGLSNRVRTKLSLSGYGSGRAETPTQDYQSTWVSDYTLRADIDETPLVVERSYDGSLLDALRDIADVSSSAFEFRWDDGPAVHWTRIGQRSSAVDVDPSNYDVQRSREDLIASAEVHGAAQSIVREPITAVSGEAVALDHSLVQEGSVNVYDPENDEVFEEGLDYAVGYRDGIVTVHGEGSIVNGQLLLIDYRYKPRGSYSAPGVSGREIVRDVPGATNDRMCGQLAERLVEDLSEPRIEAEVTLPVSVTDWSVIDELSIPGVPIDESLHLRQARSVPGETTLTLGTRRTVSEAVQQLRDRVQTVSRRV